jgi:magnesium chelatase family protein
MLSTVKSMALNGLDGYLVSIQTDISEGMPYFQIVGLPDVSVKESKERVLTAIKNSKVKFLSKRIIINLAPANTRKEGSNFDLPIAIGILIAINVIKNPNLASFLEESIFIGELALDGSIEKVNGILPIGIEAKLLGIKRLIVPKQNAKEASIINGLEIIAVSNLQETIEYLNDTKTIKKVIHSPIISGRESNNKIDFSEVRGQENVKRALEVAAAGGHNCLLIRIPWFRKNNAG